MSSLTSRKHFNAQVDALLWVEVQARGEKPFFKEHIVRRVALTVDYPNKHDERVWDGLIAQVTRRANLILHKTRSGRGLRVYEAYRVPAGYVWQSVRGMSHRHVLSILRAYGRRRTAIDVKFCHLEDLFDLIEELGIDGDGLIASAWDAFEAGRSAARRAA